MRLATKTVQVLLGLAFLGAGAQKLVGTDKMVDDFARYRYPPWFRLATGAVEIGGAVGMLLGLVRPALATLGGLLLVPTMVGALATQARLGDPAKRLAPPAVLLGLALFVGGSARGGQTPARDHWLGDLVAHRRATA